MSVCYLIGRCYFLSDYYVYCYLEFYYDIWLNILQVFNRFNYIPLSLVLSSTDIPNPKEPAPIPLKDPHYLYEI